MRNWVDRLIRCGIPEKTAQRIISMLFKERRMMELIAYVKLTEEATEGGRHYERLPESAAGSIRIYAADASDPAADATGYTGERGERSQDISDRGEQFGPAAG